PGHRYRRLRSGERPRAMLAHRQAGGCERSDHGEADDEHTLRALTAPLPPMLVYAIRRSLQAVLVLTVMSVIVFAGVFAIGNPIDILINPQADQMERERAIAAFGLDQPLWRQYGKFLLGALHGD